MLNFLYGWCGSEKAKYRKYIENSIEEKYLINSHKNESSFGGICSFSKYKPSINYCNDKYILSFIGQINTSTNISSKEFSGTTTGLTGSGFPPFVTSMLPGPAWTRG